MGFDLLEELKNAAAAGVKEARHTILRRGGQAIAATPEGQAAIEDTMIAKAKARAQAAGSSALGFVRGIPTPVLVGLGVVAFVLLRRRRR